MKMLRPSSFNVLDSAYRFNRILNYFYMNAFEKALFALHNAAGELNALHMVHMGG